MTRPQLEVADVFRSHGDAFLEKFGEAIAPEQRRALKDLALCRTMALGGHVEACDRCGHRQIAFNSCRNRHCPKCQATAAAQWMESQAAQLLPTSYFHLVFTLPATLGPIALQNPRVVYGLLFQAASQTLLQVAADPKHLGARIGFLAVLHTWGQNLHHHPHVHCVVPGGGLSLDGSSWISCREGFFLPVRVLSRVFRGKFLALLGQAFDQGRLSFAGKLSALANADQFQLRLTASAQTEWVVYAKPPFGGPEQVLKYLARYTHRVAITNRRLIALEEDEVRFHWKDYAQGGVQKTMTLPVLEFIRRILMHVLPSGFVRIRHYGFLANRLCQEQLARCRALLGVVPTPEEEPSLNPAAPDARAAERAPQVLCPVCGEGRMVIIERLAPIPIGSRGVERFAECFVFDTS